jgi:exopolyphosphatase/guanosine-5'-triphosphate,3'-diphosphate pyrophosphatase
MSAALHGPLAAIDMGSNSFRLEIGQLQHGRYRRIDYLKETVRLGAGLDADGLLTEARPARGLACLRRFAAGWPAFEAPQVRAVATQTLREARNRNAFLLRARRRWGYPIEVISGREEARLIYAGVAQLQPGQPTPGDRHRRPLHRADPGPGPRPLVAESFRSARVSLSMRFFPDGVTTSSASARPRWPPAPSSRRPCSTFAPRLWHEALGSSGTAGAVSQILQAAGVTDGRITPEGLRWCIDRCLQAGPCRPLDAAGAQARAPRRAARRPGHPVHAGHALRHRPRCRPAKGALRQGVIIDLHERLQGRSAGPAGRRARQPRWPSCSGASGRHAPQAQRVRRWRWRCSTARCPTPS